MADLYNLDAELENYSEHEELDQVDGQEDGEDVDSDKNDGNVPVPEVLRQAAQRMKNLPSKQLDQSVEEEEEEDDIDDWQQSGVTLKATEQLLLDLTYHRLGKLWAQECHSPELVPLDHDTIAAMSEQLRSAASGETINDIALQNAIAGNASMQALVESILRIDADRLKFLLADLLKRRLAKIEAHPLHMRSMTDRMSEHEVRYSCSLVELHTSPCAESEVSLARANACLVMATTVVSSQVAFLKAYGAAVEQHLQSTVTDHFPQQVWKQLDAPDMIDEPDLNAFVFCKCLLDVSIDDQLRPSGSCIIVRYERVRELLLQGQVELM
jgi:DNA replication complex GINS protein SLD5 C-terminus